ncbi:hypothetical protein EDE08_101654 [Bradyrhizobium sp. R2.2-H]|jgi:hypothetical protein|uniref:hypothetical protein n=1 Tax=unclassified Bradyrhizobium TaxID=2631580 RepID=UPI00104942A2|nr:MULTISPECIES: hypothetical protein [unclassified Bradyrhizobium]TCU78872.1 hypothetical protein EDE10_101655 [Bradyrhizobium sp. Y-H1]TCU80955.1 hypothetical protein EDE08_101654 [Bradyrhizobium sp. R2.2-H]
MVSVFVGVAAFVSSLFGIVQPAPQAHEPSLGTALPSAPAVFETSLQSRISSTDTSLTLVANSVRGGSSLSGYNCFTVDEGRTDAEYMCGTVSGTSVSSLTRGLDPATGTSSNSALKFAHRVGANVKITDFPVLQILRNQANGTETYPNTLHYASGVTPTLPSDLTDKEYADSLAFAGAGVIDATTASKGVVELATGCEAASSTVTGGSGPLVVPASLATSTYNAATAPCRVLSTGNDGLIDQGFLPTTISKNITFAGTDTFSSSTVIGSFNAVDIGKNVQVFTGSGTFLVPTNVKKVSVEMVGSGGGSSGCSTSSSCTGSPGSSGEYRAGIIDVSATTSVAVTVGTGGTASSDGTSSRFSTFMVAGSGRFNAAANTGSGGDIAIPGALGSVGAVGSALCVAISGTSRFGTPFFWGSGSGTGGGAGQGYGNGHSGGCEMNNDNAAGSGGSGLSGILIVRW